MSQDSFTTASSTGSAAATASNKFTLHGYIRPGEEEEYAQIHARLMSELSPKGVLEQTFATEMVGASWRLRRCRIIEQDLAANPDPDANSNDARQKAVDRARAQAHNILRRSLAEIRKLQADRAGQIQQAKPAPNPGRAKQPRRSNLSESLDKLEILMGLTDQQLRRQTAESEDNSFCNSIPAPGADPAEPAGVPGNAPHNAPRNAPCPCGSGIKYKRCCGNPLQSAGNRAA